MKIDKTVVVNVDGKPVRIDDLPSDIRKDVDLFDEFRQRQADQLFELEITTLAMATKNAQIAAKIKAHLTPPQPVLVPTAETIAAGNDDDGSTT